MLEFQVIVFVLVLIVMIVFDKLSLLYVLLATYVHGYCNEVL